MSEVVQAPVLAVALAGRVHQSQIAGFAGFDKTFFKGDRQAFRKAVVQKASGRQSVAILDKLDGFTGRHEFGHVSSLDIRIMPRKGADPASPRARTARANVSEKRCLFAKGGKRRAPLPARLPPGNPRGRRSRFYTRPKMEPTMIMTNVVPTGMTRETMPISG